MRRIAELDGLRGVAAVLIVAYHLFPDSLPAGWAAVEVFFVLSGFLITGILLRHPISWRFLVAFYGRRGLRIWPIYYLVLFALVACRLSEPAALPYYATYTQQIPRYWGGAMPLWLLMQHTWTLALEEQFYLIWPALMLLAGQRRTGAVALCLAAASVVVRVAGVNWWLLAGRCDGFALGGLLAAIVAESSLEKARQQSTAWAIGFGTMALALIGFLAASGRLFGEAGPLAMAVRTTAASLGSFALVALVVANEGHRVLGPLRVRPMVYLGTISYGIYLYHHPIVQMSGSLGDSLGLPAGPALVAMDIGLTLIVAMASWHLIERPILRFKDRLPYQVEAASVAEPARPHAGQPAHDALAPSAA